MNRDELLQMAELLRDALECLDGGEMYAHHARLPVELVLKKVTGALDGAPAKAMTDGIKPSNPTNWH